MVHNLSGLGQREEIDSRYSVYPMSCQVHEIGCTEDKLLNSALFPSPGNVTEFTSMSRKGRSLSFFACALHYVAVGVIST